VSLKSSLGEGYTVSVTFPRVDGDKQQIASSKAQNILAVVILVAERARCTELSETAATFALKAKDPHTVRLVLEVLEAQKHAGSIASYEVHGTTLEDIFIGLMGRDSQLAEGQPVEEKNANEAERAARTSTPDIPKDPIPLALSDGRQTWFFQQAWTIYRKRLLIFRRSWLSPLLAMAIACAGACIPLFFMNGRVKSCIPDFRPASAQSLLLPWSLAMNLTVTAPFRGVSPLQYQAIVAPPNAMEPLSTFFTDVTVTTVADQQALIDTIQQQAQNLSFGGIYMNTPGNESLAAFEASNIVNGPTVLNLVSNIWLATADGANGSDSAVIAANYMPFNARAGDQLTPMKWVCHAFGNFRAHLINYA